MSFFSFFLFFYFSGGQRVAAVSQLLCANAAPSLLRVLAALSPKEVHAAETLVSDLVWLLYRIALRDPKFSSKVRSAGASKVLHVVLRTQASGGRLLLPALHILQVVTKNRKGVCTTVPLIRWVNDMLEFFSLIQMQYCCFKGKFP